MRLNNGEVLLAWPLATHTITAGWYYSDGKLHRAIDLRAAVSTPVYAAEDGTVDWVQAWDGRSTSGNQSYGTAVRIRHADYAGKTLQTRYAHLSQALVRPGDNVREGQLIGYTGNTGNSTGPHLHFEVIWDGVRRNPLVWLDGDLNTASAAVYTYGPGEGPVQRPVLPTAPAQILVAGPLSDGDLAIFGKLADWLGLTGAGLYAVEVYDNGTRAAVLGPVSAGDARIIYRVADWLGLVDRGLLQAQVPE